MINVPFPFSFYVEFRKHEGNGGAKFSLSFGNQLTSQDFADGSPLRMTVLWGVAPCCLAEV
jgi:hypothetical protein